MTTTPLPATAAEPSFGPGWMPCTMVTADFGEDTITVKVEGPYIVAAGDYFLVKADEARALGALASSAPPDLGYELDGVIADAENRGFDAVCLETVRRVRRALSGAGAQPVSESSLQAEVDRLTAILNTPELHDFANGAVLEAAHQRERWDANHDAGKEPQDWFWLLGYLGGKALKAHADGDIEKALHHTISSAAVLANWHAAIAGTHTAMRPGIDPVARGVEAGLAAPAQQGPKT